MSGRHTSGRDPTDQFRSKVSYVVLVGALSIALAATLILGAEVFLLFFAGIILAVLLGSLARWVQEKAGLRYPWALGLTCLAILAVSAAAYRLSAPSIAAQFDELASQLPRSLASLKESVESSSWGKWLLRGARPGQVLGDGSQVISRATGVLSGFLGAAANLVILLFVGLYGAADPQTYKRGLLFLFPPRHQDRAAEIYDEMGGALRCWLLGSFFSMTIVGVLTTAGLWLLGIPLALILGLIAAALTFIPNLGPVISAVPAVLLAFGTSPSLALYVGLLYLGVQLVESYLLTPLIQERTISLPPLLIIFTQVLFGVFWGILGVALATPFAAIALVAARELLSDHRAAESNAKAA